MKFRSTRVARQMLMLDKSVIVSAHPDDEVLFFSSIVGKADAVVLCFLECASKPHWGAGRRKSIEEHPIKNIVCLGLHESETFHGPDWNNPVITPYGIEITHAASAHEIYSSNYRKLKEQLRPRLQGCRNVFTHNPWGEYGHAEHVQVYRAVKELQGEVGYTLWFSNYCSNRSFPLMLRYVSGFTSEYVTLKTNKTAGRTAKDVYKKNGCWTWYGDWEWFNEESFMKDRDGTGGDASYGHIFPLNMIKMRQYSEPGSGPRKAPLTADHLREAIARLVRRVRRES